MDINKYEFDVLAYLYKNEHRELTQRNISNECDVALGAVNTYLKKFVSLNLIEIKEKRILLTKKAENFLEKHRVKNAIILAAGFSARLAPVSLKTPKPLVKVNGISFIESIIDSLHEAGIKNIVIVVGDKKEQFNCLNEKYDGLIFVENPIYNETNNISSVYYALDYLDCTYICEADLLISTPNMFSCFNLLSHYFGIYEEHTNDWCFKTLGTKLIKTQIGGNDCYRMAGISYWNHEDSLRLKEDVKKVFHEPGGKECFWDAVPLIKCKKNYKLFVKGIKRESLIEIDNYSELIEIDPSYKNFNY